MISVTGGAICLGSAFFMSCTMTHAHAIPILQDNYVWCWPAAVEPDNAALRAFRDHAQALRDQGKPTLPSTLGRERAINPFLRTDQPSVQAAARARAGRSLATQAQVFAEIRGWKDQF